MKKIAKWIVEALDVVPSYRDLASLKTKEKRIDFMNEANKKLKNDRTLKRIARDVSKMVLKKKWPR
jgi:Zn-finger domain-containing protein